MTNKHFLEDFKLGNYFIAHGHNVMVADINQVNDTMNRVYDIVLFRNFVSNDVSKYDATKKLYLDKIATIPDIERLYSKYQPGLYVDMSLKYGIPMCERAKTGIGYGVDMPYRAEVIQENPRFVTQYKYDTYYHTVVIDDSPVYSFSEAKGLKKLESSYPDFVDKIVMDLKGSDIPMYEIIYALDSEGKYRLSFIDVTYVTLDIRLCSESAMFSKIMAIIERKK